MKSPDSRFYCPLIEKGILSLDESESNHAIRVCRAREGDTLQLCDGLGHYADAKIISANAKACTVVIDSVEQVSQEKPYLNLAIGCLKDDALEEVVFHAAQTEINCITFLRTDFSQECKNSDLHKLIRRSELKSLVSLKQSKKAWLTQIKGPIEFDKWIENYNGDLILCDINGLRSVNLAADKQKTVTLLVGPEGGFSPREINLAKNYNKGNVHLLNLGNTRLRARTAAIIALGKLV